MDVAVKKCASWKRNRVKYQDQIRLRCQCIYHYECHINRQSLSATKYSRFPSRSIYRKTTRSSIILFCSNAKHTIESIPRLNSAFNEGIVVKHRQKTKTKASAITLTPSNIPSSVTIINPTWAQLTSNITLMSGFYGWLVAQVLKVFTNRWREKKLTFSMLWSSGGMPSSHSSLVCAVTTAVALLNGLSSSLFPICLGFSLIVMYDAAGVRRHAGKQAEVLNVIVEDMKMFGGHPISQGKLKELLGHTPFQVIMGAATGIVTALIYIYGFL